MVFLPYRLNQAAIRACHRQYKCDKVPAPNDSTKCDGSYGRLDLLVSPSYSFFDDIFLFFFIKVKIPFVLVIPISYIVVASRCICVLKYVFPRISDSVVVILGAI